MKLNKMSLLSNEYYNTGKLHREDGPAIKYFDGFKEWYLNGFLHREDGPAVEDEMGNFWFINGQKISCKNNEEFLEIIKKL